MGSYISMPSFEGIFSFTSMEDPPHFRTQSPKQWPDKRDQPDLKVASVLVLINTDPGHQGYWSSHLPAAMFGDSNVIPTG